MAELEPDSSAMNLANERVTNAKLFGKFSLGGRPVKRPYGGNFLTGQLCPRVGHASVRRVQAERPRMVRILTRRNPLQVFYTVVRLASINVVDLIGFRGGLGKKRLRHQAMNEKVLSDSLETQGNSPIASLVQIKPVEPARFPALGTPGSHQLPRATNSMAFFKPNDWFPNFLHGCQFTKAKGATATW